MTNSEMIERLKEFRAMVKALSVCTNIPDEAVKGDMIPDIEALTRAIELLEKEEKGELLRTPCPEGTIVYRVFNEFDCDSDCYGEICYSCKKPCKHEYKDIRRVIFKYSHDIDDFGKTVFLTREEAEQSLKGDL